MMLVYFIHLTVFKNSYHKKYSSLNVFYLRVEVLIILSERVGENMHRLFIYLEIIFITLRQKKELQQEKEM